MISKTFSTSVKRDALFVACPKMAEFCEFLFVMLVVHANDQGRLPGDEFTVKMQVDPVSRRKLADFVAGLHLLHQVGLIIWYHIEDKKFIQIVNFASHQDLKGHNLRDGKIPACPGPEALIGRDRRHEKRPVNPPMGEVGEDSPNPPLSKDNLIQANPRESNLTQAIALARESDTGIAFEEFRQAYPAARRVGGKEGRRAFDGALNGRDLSLHLPVMLAALEQHKRSEQWQNPKYIPLMTTWLNQERWLSELPESGASDLTRQLMQANRDFDRLVGE